ncbi:hypothetical protein WCWAEYFT_CDS0091 [Vibrio phage VB_VaC_TDDLMA]
MPEYVPDSKLVQQLLDEKSPEEIAAELVQLKHQIVNCHFEPPLDLPPTSASENHQSYQKFKNLATELLKEGY